MNQSELSTSQQETLSKIYQIINKTKEVRQKMLENGDEINKRLADFSLNHDSLGSDVYGENKYDNNDNIEFQIPEEGKFITLRNMINNDIDDIDEAIEYHRLLADLIKDVPQSVELLEASSISLEDINELINERNARVGLLADLENIYDRLEFNQNLASENAKKEKTNIQPVVNPSGNTGGSNGGSGGGSGGGGGGVYPTNFGGYTGDVSGLGEVSQTTRPTLTNYNTAVHFSDLNFLSYQGELNQNFFGTCEANLNSHAQQISSLLSNIVINGETPGADFYGVQLDPNAPDIKTSVLALQLALDAVDAHIEATKNYITLLNNKITANEARIVTLKAKAKAAEDEKEDASGYYAEIETLEAENKELAAKIEEYNTKLEEENKVYNELGNYWNAYNRVSGGLNSAFAAVDGMDKLSRMGADADLYGLSLTAAQKQQLFNSLGATVNDLKGGLSDVFNKKGEYCGGLTSDQINYIVAGCSILGKIGTKFGDNLNTFKEFNSAASAAGGYEHMSPAEIEKFTGSDNTVTKEDGTANTELTEADTGKAGLSANSTDGKDKIDGTYKSDDKNSNKDLAAIDPSKAMIATLDGCKLAVQYTSIYKAKSDVIMDAYVEEWMTNNAGKMVLLDNNVRKALGLQTKGYINIPSSYNAEEAFPFLYWLTGTGFANVGEDYLRYEPLAKRLLAGKYRNDNGIIYIPTGWGSGSTEGNNSTYNGTMLNHDLHQFMNGLNIDKEHLSCAGSSVGAYAAAYLVNANPNVFSAVAMTGGGFGGPWGNVSVDDAIKNSPETSFIYYIADNDFTSQDSHGNGVRNYTYSQYQKMKEAGMNAVYYEIGGGIWHTYACDRFPNAKMLNDLFGISLGEKYNCPDGIVQISSQQSLDAVLGNDNNTWYHSLSV